MIEQDKRDPKNRCEFCWNIVKVRLEVEVGTTGTWKLCKTCTENIMLETDIILIGGAQPDENL